MKCVNKEKKKKEISENQKTKRLVVLFYFLDEKLNRRLRELKLLDRGGRFNN